MTLIQFIRDWSEVWALLIPLIVIVIFKPGPKQMRPIILYVMIGFALNFCANFTLQYSQMMPSWMISAKYVEGKAYYYVNNNILYNIHSVARVLFFSWYIIHVRQYRYPVLLKGLLLSYIIFVVINFSFGFESIFELGSALHAAESITLLVMCLIYFFRSIQDESQVNWLKHPSFLVSAGVSLYEVITFFIFLFFYPLHDPANPENYAFAVVTMRIYTITFVVLCVLLTLALYKSRRAARTVA
jgi:hypothetical protein